MLTLENNIMNILKVLQGTEEWLSIRAKHLTASEAPSAFGVSKFLSRNDLLKQKFSGLCPEISDFQQSIFDKGHEAESNARVIAEDIICEDLCPITATLSVDGLHLLASYDGMTLGKNLIWEHKLWSEELAKQIEENNIDQHYSIQLDQQLLISGAEKCLFMTSDGTTNNCRWMWYETTEEKKEAIVLTWKQFQKDLEMYEQKEFTERPQAAAIMQLPALSIQIKGEVTVSNLPEFKQAAETFISKINTNLETDEDFVNAETTVKFCDETEKKLESAKAAAIGQTASIDELMKTIDFIKESIRSKRLTLEKLVKTQKESIKTNIINDAYKLCVEHQSSIAAEFKNISFASLASLSRQSFETACKNKRTLASLHNAVDTEVAAIKIKLDDLARVIRKNSTHLPEDLSLFRDLQSIITKQEDDFKLLVQSRLAEQKRKEEEAKIRAEAELKAAEERGRAQALIEKERERVAAEQEQKRIAEASERMRLQKEAETKRIESLPADIKSVLADEEKQAKEIVSKALNVTPITKQELIGFDKWWEDTGAHLSINNDPKNLARAAWYYAKSVAKD